MKLFETLVGIYRDISNFVYYVKTVKKIRNSDRWKELKLRHDWFYKIYTVLNLRTDIFQEKIMAEYEAANDFKPIGEFLMDNNLGEIVRHSIDRLEGEDAYLVQIRFWPLYLFKSYIFKKIIPYTLLFVFILYIIKILVVKYNVFNYIINFLR